MDNTNGTVKGDDDGDDEEGQGYNANGFAPREANGDDAGAELPCCRAAIASARVSLEGVDRGTRT